MARIRIILPALLMVAIFMVIYTTSGGHSPHPLRAVKEYGVSRDFIFSPTEKKKIAHQPRYAITSSVQTASFASMAVMLAYSIQKHNDLKAMDAELVLLVRLDEKDGLTAENKTRLEKAGWKIRVAEELHFKGVNTNDIRPWHKHNLNKLHLWSWTEYERIIFIDADVVCKGSLAELWQMPGDFAAAPDVWWNILTDSRFNSGVIVFRPSVDTFHDMVAKVSDPKYHKPNDADQAFLQAYYQFRYFGLPYKYNFNLVMYQFHRDAWDSLWNEAVLIHFTMRKPRSNPAEHCHKGCHEWEPLEWYGQYFQEMLAYHGWEKELPLIA